jgi:hypothetical protein
LERTDRAPEMTALEFEDDDEGFCIGYARILKTPQKERRIKLKPMKKIKSDEEDENEDKNGAERKNVAETEPMQQQKVGNSFNKSLIWYPITFITTLIFLQNCINFFYVIFD